MRKPKNKQPRAIASINFGMYPGYCMFVYGYSWDELMIELKKRDDKEWILPISDDKEIMDGAEYQAMHRTVENTKTGEVKNYFYIMYKKKFLFRDMSYVILAHEVLHIIQFYTKPIFDRNVEIENEAYLHSHIMKQCLDAIRLAK